MYEILNKNPVLSLIFIMLVVALVVIMLAMYCRNLGMEKIREKVYKAFVEAENNFNYGENQEKFEWVVKTARRVIPYPYNLFITEKFLRKTIQLWFDLTKDLLDDGKINGTQKGE